MKEERNTRKKDNKVSTYILLHTILMIYAVGGIFSKKAGKDNKRCCIENGRNHNTARKKVREFRLCTVRLRRFPHPTPFRSHGYSTFRLRE